MIIIHTPVPLSLIFYSLFSNNKFCKVLSVTEISMYDLASSSDNSFIFSSNCCIFSITLITSIYEIRIIIFAFRCNSLRDKMINFKCILCHIFSRNCISLFIHMCFSALLRMIGRNDFFDTFPDIIRFCHNIFL